MSAPRRVAIGAHSIFVDDDQPTFWDRVEVGGWELGTLEVLSQHLRPGTRFLDVGAWVGALTLYAASLGAEVLALEADPKALDQLRRNLAVNPNLAPRVSVIPKALAPAPGPVRMGARRKPGDSMSSVLLADRETTWSVQGITARELASGEGHFDLVKIDIEGGEYAVLPSLQPLLQQTEALLLALHPDILAGSGEPTPGDVARRALHIVRDWQFARVSLGGSLPASFEELVRAGPAEWLFTRTSEG